MYAQIFVAGTFDRLHKGHKFLLTRACAEGERVTIGLTSDAFVKNFKIKTLNVKIKSYKERKKLLEYWLDEQKKQAAIIPIDDPYEPAASMPDLDALLVTPDNKKRGEEINAMRKVKGLRLVMIVEVALVAAEDVKPISSTRIRAREIDRAGRLIMPDNLRPELQKPLGTVLTGNAITQSIERCRGNIIITVGDMSTKTFLDAGIMPTLSIIDGKVGRKPFPEVVDRLQPRRVRPFEAKSGPGFISKKATQIIQAILEKEGNDHYALIIDGEEDLLVLPAVQYAPIGSAIYYGQPGKGLVEVIVTEEKKREVAVLLARFLS